MSGVSSSESRRLEYYARFLDDERLSPEERTQIARHLNFLLGANAADPEEARQRFLPFVRAVWPKFIEGRHHRIMTEVFERVERGRVGTRRFSRCRFGGIVSGNPTFGQVVEGCYHQSECDSPLSAFVFCRLVLPGLPW